MVGGMVQGHEIPAGNDVRLIVFTSLMLRGEREHEK
jgi:hypothetical protein